MRTVYRPPGANWAAPEPRESSAPPSTQSVAFSQITDAQLDVDAMDPDQVQPVAALLGQEVSVVFGGPR